MKIHIKAYTTILLLIITGISFAQPNLQWSLNAENTPDIQINAIHTIDSDTYVIGQFRDSLKIGLIDLRGNGIEDIFLLKIDDDGHPLWGTCLSEQGVNNASKLASCEKTLFLGGSITTEKKCEKVPNPQAQSLFIAAVDTAGKQKWMLYFPFNGRASFDVLETGSDGLIYIGGTIKGCIKIGKQNYCFQNGERAFSIILSQNGELLHSIFSDGTGNHRNVAAKFGLDGQIYIMTAICPGTYLFDNTKNNDFYVAKSNTILLSKVNEKLEKIWSKEVTAEAFLEGIELQTNSQGDIYAGINFNTGITTTGFKLKADSKLAIAIMSWSVDGKLLWAQTIQSPEYCRLMDFKIIDGDTLLMTGYDYSGLIIKDKNSEKSKPKQNAFVLSLDKEGNFGWCKDVKTDDNNYNYGKAISFDGDGNIYFAGGYMNNDTAIKNIKRTKTGHTGAFVNKYYICSLGGIRLQTNVSSFCPGDTVYLEASPGFDSYLWNDSIVGNNRFFVDSIGNYKVVAADSKGCISTDSIDIVESPESEIIIGEDTTILYGQFIMLQVDSTYIDYNWGDGYYGRYRKIYYDKNKDQLSLVLYARQEGFCFSSDTITVTFDKNDLDEELQIYPNPVKETLWWSFNKSIEGQIIVEVYDARRILLYRKDYLSVSAGMGYPIPMYNYAPGNYLVRFRINGQMINRNFVKQ